MIFINNSGLIGDTLATLPVLSHLARDQKVYAAYDRVDLLALARRANPNIENIWDCPDSRRSVVVSANKAFHYQATLHMSQAHFKVLGMPIPSTAVPAPIRIDRKPVASYDYLISPFSRSNHNHNKEWLWERWEVVFSELMRAGKTVCILGNSDYDPLVGVEFCYDKDWDTVGSLMLEAGTVITVDNGMGHLAAAVGCNHRLLCGNAISAGWVSYSPSSLALYGSPLTWSIDQVMEAITR